MANYYTQMCSKIDGEQEQLNALDQMITVINDHWDEIIDWVPEDVVENFPLAAPNVEEAQVLQSLAGDFEGSLGVSVNRENEDGSGEMILTSDESVSMDPLCEVIQTWLTRFDSDKGVGIEFANSTSRPMLDGYGGGAVFITKDDINYTNTNRWLSEQIKVHEAKNYTEEPGM